MLCWSTAGPTPRRGRDAVSMPAPHPRATQPGRPVRGRTFGVRRPDSPPLTRRGCRTLRPSRALRLGVKPGSWIANSTEQSQNVYENKGSAGKSTTPGPCLSKEGHSPPRTRRGLGGGGALRPLRALRLGVKPGSWIANSTEQSQNVYENKGSLPKSTAVVPANPRQSLMPSADGHVDTISYPGAGASCPLRARHCGAKGGQNARAPLQRKELAILA